MAAGGFSPVWRDRLLTGTQKAGVSAGGVGPAQWPRGGGGDTRRRPGRCSSTLFPSQVASVGAKDPPAPGTPGK